MRGESILPIDQELLLSIKENRFSGKRLSLTDRGLTDEDVIQLVDTLSHNPNITELDVSDNNISNTGAKILASLSTVSSLNVSANNIGSDGCLELAKSNLQSLDISANPVEDGIAAFSETASLQELIATECNITDAGAEQLFLSPSIKTLDLSTNQLSGTCLKNVASNAVLKNLRLAQNLRLQEEYFCHFSQNKSLVCLNLTSVSFGEGGVSFLAKNQSIQELILMQCSLTDVNAFSENTTLKKLLLHNNRITDDGVKNLIGNNSLLKLVLSSNLITNATNEHFKKSYETTSGGAFTRTEAFLAKLQKKSQADNAAMQIDHVITPAFSIQLRRTQSPTPDSVGKRKADVLLADSNYGIRDLSEADRKDFLDRIQESCQVDHRKKQQLSHPSTNDGGISSSS